MKKKNDLSHIPTLPGVYFFKDTHGTILYIGKAKSLRDRVRSYFQKYSDDWKVQHLIDEYKKIDFIITKNETEALLLEAELIGQYRPKFNVLLKSGQPFVYILMTNTKIPKLLIVRNKKQKGNYIGPFLQKSVVKSVHNFVIRRFNLNLCNKTIENGCLDYHIGNCAGSCRKNFDSESYLFRTQLAFEALQNNQTEFTKKIKTQVAKHADALEFEKAQKLNNYLQDLEIIFNTIQIKFDPKKFKTDVFVATHDTPNFSQNAFAIAQELQNMIQSSKPIYVIDCFDISHFQSKQMVGACVRFSHGVPVKNKFRRFKIKTLETQDDYAALQEIVTRRYRNGDMPDLILIDGGKGQLNAIKKILPDATISSLAKREETLFCNAHPEGVLLDVKTPIGKLLIELRDYTHHFAISYHRLKKEKL